MTQLQVPNATANNEEQMTRSPLEFYFGYYLCRQSGNGIGDFFWFESEQAAIDSLSSRLMDTPAFNQTSTLKQLPRTELVASDGSPIVLRWAGSLGDLQFGSEPFESVVQDDFILGVFPYPAECDDPHRDTHGFALHLENYQHWPVPLR